MLFLLVLLKWTYSIILNERQLINGWVLSTWYTLELIGEMLIHSDRLRGLLLIDTDYQEIIKLDSNNCQCLMTIY